MAIEIERKFLVKGEIPEGVSTEMVQAYLSLDPERTVRVRLEGEVAKLTIKGRSEGISRKEFEYEIPEEDARELMALAIGAPVEKTRTRIEVGKHLWEVDVFRGANAGLVLAEVELGSEDEVPVLPDWVGEEVSDDPRYFNSYLARSPFAEWGE
ncbi:MAG: CYTH domain-containing protein [Verrucomicrobiaceae bacterium]